MTDRDLLAHLGRAFVAALAIMILAVSGVIYAETTDQTPRIVDVSRTR